MSFVASTIADSEPGETSASIFAAPQDRPILRPARSRRMTPAQRQYQQAQVETASPTRLVIMLYDGAIRFCMQAIEAMHAKDLEMQNNSLVKAQRIIGELMSALDRKAGGEVAENLFRVYVHLLELLVNANLHDQVQPVETVVHMLTELRESWIQVERQTLPETPAVPSNGAGVQHVG
jgi:flagellar protein FliS